jgi:hypothetical protein
MPQERFMNTLTRRQVLLFTMVAAAGCRGPRPMEATLGVEGMI